MIYERIRHERAKCKCVVSLEIIHIESSVNLEESEKDILKNKVMNAVEIYHCLIDCYKTPLLTQFVPPFYTGPSIQTGIIEKLDDIDIYVQQVKNSIKIAPNLISNIELILKGFGILTVHINTDIDNFKGLIAFAEESPFPSYPIIAFPKKILLKDKQYLCIITYLFAYLLLKKKINTNIDIKIACERFVDKFLEDEFNSNSKFYCENDEEDDDYLNATCLLDIENILNGIELDEILSMIEIFICQANMERVINKARAVELMGRLRECKNILIS